MHYLRRCKQCGQCWHYMLYQTIHLKLGRWLAYDNETTTTAQIVRQWLRTTSQVYDRQTDMPEPDSAVCTVPNTISIGSAMMHYFQCSVHVRKQHLTGTWW